MKTNTILQGDCIEKLKELPDNSVDAIVTDPPYELNFMGKGWDISGIANNVDMWKECLRVLKSGGFLLSFGGTRTYHRMTCGIEDAGFEIRDCIMWLYGSGFPKSLNIGKQIDKIQGNEREVVGKGISGKEETHKTYNMSKGGSQVMGGEFDISKGNTEWEGWGTALKPAVEPIVVARKPLSEKNVALNVLKWGTGGINIDVCRIKFENTKNPATNPLYRDKNNYRKPSDCGQRTGEIIKFTNSLNPPNHQGRFPANIILDEVSAEMLDEQSGNVGGDTRKSKPSYDKRYWGNAKNKELDSLYNDKGGASRFFYVAKASKSERNLGMEDIGSLDGKIPIKKNNHPTVKPIKLMEYLIKLVSRENAIILDPFIGSGTTAIACLKLNRRFIGIEKEEEYVKIAEARIKPYLEQTKLGEVENE